MSMLHLRLWIAKQNIVLRRRENTYHTPGRNSRASSTDLLPTRYAMSILVSSSIAVHVHMSPASSDGTPLDERQPLVLRVAERPARAQPRLQVATWYLLMVWEARPK